MNLFAQKIGKVVSEIPKERHYDMVALLLRAESAGLWDLLVYAPWASKNIVGGIDHMIASLSKHLTKEEMRKISGIVVLDKNDPAMKSLRDCSRPDLPVVELRGCDVAGNEIREGYVFHPLLDADR
ncbi:hypothetical protein NNJEOMEG_01355 [Fundidesulfovibrio magnetotacticus]|uniref:Uncharacterized protein n=1 Tax=Fundidesulfovibrio magnetotacticus TaxID=2730080 RepID=A0A6V8LSH4_9BACT|nr:hypothetical protein [Fundidesulfovibrio magnetotacticus]GFK93521.1 hypothetical protein NNJEOMEG_01355 [Fundidesulfovibrio magnetotacticus]